MANRRRSSRKYTEDMVKGVLGLSIFAYFAIANWWKTIPKESRVIFFHLQKTGKSQRLETCHGRLAK
jgi:hypothetical protein